MWFSVVSGCRSVFLMAFSSPLFFPLWLVILTESDLFLPHESEVWSQSTLTEMTVWSLSWAFFILYMYMWSIYHIETFDLELFIPQRCLYIAFILLRVLCVSSGSIVSVGDPKKKYTRFEKIGQGWVSFLTYLVTYLVIHVSGSTNVYSYGTFLFFWSERLVQYTQP